MKLGLGLPKLLIALELLNVSVVLLLPLGPALSRANLSTWLVLTLRAPSDANNSGSNTSLVSRPPFRCMAGSGFPSNEEPFLPA